MRDIHSLTPEHGTLLHRDSHADPVLEVREHDGLRWLHCGERAIQSAMRVGQPSELVLPYMQCMLVALLFNPEPATILNLGMGGGAFNRFFDAYKPGAAIDSVEHDPRVVALAERFFEVDTQRCRVESAEDYLAAKAGIGEPGSVHRYDLVLCDLFSEAGVPGPLLVPATFRQLARLASDAAVLAINLLPGDEQELLAVLQLLGAEFRFRALLEVSGYRNIVLLAALQDPTPRWDHSARETGIPGIHSFLDTLRLIPASGTACGVL